MRRLRAEGVDFAGRAPRVFAFEAALEASLDDVWDAISADPSTWTWFPRLRDASYLSSPPHGVDSVRQVTMSGTTYRETILVWDPPTRWAYRVDETSAPVADALVEDWSMSVENYGGRPVTIVRWTFAIDPSALFRAAIVAAPTVMGTLFRRAMRNLDRSLPAGIVDREGVGT
jgi:hypothetical protein